MSSLLEYLLALVPAFGAIANSLLCPFWPIASLARLARAGSDKTLEWSSPRRGRAEFVWL